MLKDSDILSLVKSGDVKDRLNVTADLGTKYIQELYSVEELALVEEIFRLLCKDAEVRVRHALSESLKLSKILPQDIAMNFARDVEAVAVPILQYSEVLSDGDILEILSTPNLQKALAVSKRKNLNDNVQAKLLSYDNPEIVGNVIANDNFPNMDEDFDGFLNLIAEDSDAIRNLIKGISLPTKISEKLMYSISGEILNNIKEKYDLVPEKLTQIANHAVEISTVSDIKTTSSIEEIEILVRHLNNFGRLTNSLILSALCMGRRRFFISALAKKAGIPRKNAIILLKQGGRDGLRSLLVKADMPEKLHSAIELVLKLCNEAKANEEEEEKTIEEFCSWLLKKLEFFAERTKVEYINYMMAIVKQSQNHDPLAEYS